MQNINEKALAVTAEVSKAVLGKPEVVLKIMMAILARGHVLIEDIPGVGKTTLAQAFARAMDLTQNRVQFTPDVLPSDIVGFSLYQKETGKFVYHPGAVMCNLFLADEINRTSARTQSALLEVMEESAVTVDGAATGRMKDAEMAEFRNKTLGFVFQSFHLINSLNVLDNVELPLLYRKSTEKSRRETARAVLEKVGLSHRTKHFPSQLSGGQCQRVAIARALIGNPKIILADEPTGNLDSKTGEEIMRLLFELNREGTTIVMVTHDEHMARKTQRIVRFFDGRRIE